MRMFGRIKGVTLIDKRKSVDIRKELGVNSIKEKVREMRLCWYGHMQRMEENNEVRAVVDMRVPGKRLRGRPRGRWMDCVQMDMHALRIPRRMPRTQHFGNLEFWPLTPPSGKMRRRRSLTVGLRLLILACFCIHLFLHLLNENVLLCDNLKGQSVIFLFHRRDMQQKLSGKSSNLCRSYHTCRLLGPPCPCVCAH